MKKTGWFRFYDRMIDSPQVLELNDAEFRLLVSLWCLASTENAEGQVPYSDALLRRRVLPDHPVEDVSAMLAHLIALDLLQVEDKGYTVARWREHQYAYKSWEPEARAEQKRKERQARSSSPTIMSQDLGEYVASEGQATNGHVASVSQAKSKAETDTDVDTETESEIAPAPAREAGEAVKPGKNAPRPIKQTPLPDAFPLTERLRAIAAQDFPEVRDLDAQHKLFCAYYADHPEEKRAAWEPTWRLWMQRRAAGQFGPPTNGAGRASPTAPAYRVLSPVQRGDAS